VLEAGLAEVDGRPGLRVPTALGLELAGVLEEVNDSKRIKSAAKRERLAKAIFAHAEAVSVVSIRASQIDRIGLRPAT
jgi:ribonuclease HII